MFIITKNDLENSKISIVDVVEDGVYIEAFEILMDDCLKLDALEYSFKILDKYRVQVKKIGYLSNPIVFIYDIHPFKENQLIFKMDESEDQDE